MTHSAHEIAACVLCLSEERWCIPQHCPQVCKCLIVPLEKVRAIAHDVGPQIRRHGASNTAKDAATLLDLVGRTSIAVVSEQDDV